MRSPRAIYEMLRTGYEQRVDTISRQIETEIQSMTFECEFCGHETPESGAYETDLGTVCVGCLLWYEAQDRDESWYTQDLPEDYSFLGDF